jgi:hypothetical protein
MDGDGNWILLYLTLIIIFFVEKSESTGSVSLVSKVNYAPGQFIGEMILQLVISMVMGNQML